MQDLELEHAELLPGRETLWSCHSRHCGGGGFSSAQVGNGDVTQVGLVNIAVPILNGSNIL
jgi:hypothetical protein